MNTATETKERPIIFSGPMVRAILAGRKTQTRRVIKPQPKGWRADAYPDRYNNGPQWAFWLPDNRMTEEQTWKCPYGEPGDRLWVRETCVICDGDHMQRKTLDELLIKGPPPKSVYYVATDRIYLGEKKTPSIFMPRCASRIALGVTNVRVERLQEINEEDAKAEGVEAISVADVPRQASWSNRQDFSRLWDSINKKRGFGWDKNPWVWVVGFKVMQGS